MSEEKIEVCYTFQLPRGATPVQIAGLFSEVARKAERDGFRNVRVRFVDEDTAEVTCKKAAPPKILAEFQPMTISLEGFIKTLLDFQSEIIFKGHTDVHIKHDGFVATRSPTFR